MKKIISIALFITLMMALTVVSYADPDGIDLSGLTFEELVALKDQINLAIWNSAEWQEVEVPQGIWKVGEDIPAGKWTIKAATGASTCIYVGSEIKNGGVSVSDIFAGKYIKSAENKYYDEKTDVAEFTVDLTDGNYVQVDSGAAVFTPYAGKPSLGFK